MNKNQINHQTSKQSFFTIVIRILGMAFAAGPIYLIANNLMAIVNGASQGVITLITQKFFESVTKAVAQNSSIKDVIMMAFALSLTVILSQIINGLNNFMGMSYFKKVVGYLNGKMNSKAAKIYPIAYEDTKLLDDINKAANGANNSLGLLFTITTVFTYYTPYFLFMFFYLYSLVPILAVALVLVFIPVSLSQLVRYMVFSKHEDIITPVRRECEYYKSCVGNKETRILGAFGFFRDLYSTSVKLLNKTTWKVEKKVGLIELAMKCITLMGYLGILYLFVTTLLAGKISVSAFAAIFASIDNMFNTMDVIICRHIANMTKNLGTINNFLRFLDMPERDGTNQTKDKQKGINIENVSFRYPAAQVNAIDNISFNIKQGETVAVVGENGSGKSTFVKIALGLYEPSNGRVEIQGLDTREANTDSLFNNISAVFQNYQRYKMSLNDNIDISDIKFGDPNNIEQITKKVGLDVDSSIFPDNYNTMLSREFDGVELSGGQWQRVAIARGLYRNHDIIVLDEPTAAIDPIEEESLYKKFAEISRGKTSIIVTHRLGSAKIADRIIVMDNGKLIEVGVHDKLMELKGKYYEMYSKQAKWYIK